ncbi:MAG TPA: succinate dehydrogenase, hydrophobic membrane anchor protein [Bauldia sp.]|nr:succinate dehydrogenase, hydrophobic membrane anchor protein [Bauldia sp.]
MRTPLSRVQHLGSAHEGTEHFWRQRLTGAANAILVIATALIIVYAAGRPYEDVAALIGSPFVAPLFVLLFVSAAIHMHIGMQVIVEDYVQNEAAKIVLLAASRFFSVTVAAVAIIAILKLAVGG